MHFTWYQLTTLAIEYRHLCIAGVLLLVCGYILSDNIYYMYTHCYILAMQTDMEERLVKLKIKVYNIAS